jgi:hypothetical protein
MYRAVVSSRFHCLTPRFLQSRTQLTLVTFYCHLVYQAPCFAFWDHSTLAMEISEVRADEPGQIQSSPKNDMKAKPVPSDDRYSREALEALLKPERQPRRTDQGLEPRFFDKALIVMAIWQSSSQRLTAKKISNWISENFLHEYYKHYPHNRNIRFLLRKDDDFVKVSESQGFWFALRPGLERDLHDMRDPEGKPFDPVQHVSCHVRTLRSPRTFGLGEAAVPGVALHTHQSSGSEAPKSEDRYSDKQSQTMTQDTKRKRGSTVSEATSCPRDICGRLFQRSNDLMTHTQAHLLKRSSSVPARRTRSSENPIEDRDDANRFGRHGLVALDSNITTTDPDHVTISRSMASNPPPRDLPSEEIEKLWNSLPVLPYSNSDDSESQNDGGDDDDSVHGLQEISPPTTLGDSDDPDHDSIQGSFRYRDGDSHSHDSVKHNSKLRVEDDREPFSSGDDRESSNSEEDGESLNSGDDLESFIPDNRPAEARQYVTEDADGRKKFYDTRKETELEARRLERQQEIANTKASVDSQANRRGSLPSVALATLSVKYAPTSQREQRSPNRVFRFSKNNAASKTTPESIGFTLCDSDTTYSVPITSVVEMRQAEDAEFLIIREGSSLREKGHRGGTIPAQVTLRATSESIQFTIGDNAWSIPVGCTLEMWHAEDSETWSIGSPPEGSWHNRSQRAQIAPDSVRSHDAFVTAQSTSSSRAKTASPISTRSSMSNSTAYRKDHHENMPDLPLPTDEVSDLVPELDVREGLPQHARDDNNNRSTQEQPDARSNKIRAGNLQEDASPKALGFDDSDSTDVRLFPTQGDQYPKCNKTDLLSDNIESTVGPPKLNRVHPDPVEPRDQCLGLLSEFPYWEGTTDGSIDSVDTDGAFPHPVELEEKFDSQHGVAEETNGLEVLELGKGRNHCDDDHAALRFKLDMSKARTIDYLKAVAVLSLYAFFVGAATACSEIAYSMKVTAVKSRHSFFVSTLLALCIGVIHFAARDSLSQMPDLPAQDATLVYGRKSTAEGASTIQIEQSTDTPHERSSRLNLPTISTRVSLRRLFGSVLCSVSGVVRQYLEPPVPLGMRRIRWQCRCGSLIYDDFLERKPASKASSADKELDCSGLFSSTEKPMYQGQDSGKSLGPVSTGDPGETGTTSFPQQPGKGPSQRPAQRDVGYKLGDTSASSNNTSSSPPGTGSLPIHSLGTNIVKNTAVSIPRIPSHLEFLLLCVPFKSHANKLLNIDTTTSPVSDMAFFHLLRQAYTKSRGQFRSFFSVRALLEIRFVHFDAFRNDLVDVRKYDCILPDTQKDNYVYRALPDEHEPPPIGKNRMRHLYDYPDHADDVLLDCFSVVPRKLRERLAVVPGKSRSEGWGICFIEGVSWPRVCALGLAGVLASTIFGVVWTVVQKDIQGGFGVASYMLGVLVLGLGALQGAFEM